MNDSESSRCFKMTARRGKVRSERTRGHEGRLEASKRTAGRMRDVDYFAQHLSRASNETSHEDKTRGGETTREIVN